MRAGPGRSWHESPQSVRPPPRPIALSPAASAGRGLPTRRAQPGPPRPGEHAQCASGLARWIRLSWFSGGLDGGGTVGGARDLSPEERISERRESWSWMGNVLGVETLEGGLGQLQWENGGHFLAGLQGSFVRQRLYKKLVGAAGHRGNGAGMALADSQGQKPSNSTP